MKKIFTWGQRRMDKRIEEVFIYEILDDSDLLISFLNGRRKQIATVKTTLG